VGDGARDRSRDVPAGVQVRGSVQLTDRRPASGGDHRSARRSPEHNRWPSPGQGTATVAARVSRTRRGTADERQAWACSRS
jgi:hypothetical protein